MTTESRLQTKIIKYLQSLGFYVIKCQVPPAPVGCPDILALYLDWWIALEVKSSDKSHKQALQEATVEKLDGWSYCKFVTPESWPKIKDEIEAML